MDLGNPSFLFLSKYFKMETIMDNNLRSLDLLTVLSFAISLQNLDMNVSQLDIQHMSKFLDNDLMKAVEDIHEHLRIQDEKLDYIIKLLERKEDSNETR